MAQVRRLNARFDVLAWRNRMGLHQLECCALLECSPRQWRRWEREGHNPPRHHIATMEQLESNRVMGVSPTRALPATAKVDRRVVRIPPANEPSIRQLDILPSSW